MNALSFTTPQLLMMYGWCETAEEKSAADADAAERNRDWDECAVLFEELTHSRAIMAVIMAELQYRNTPPNPRRRPPRLN